MPPARQRAAVPTERGAAPLAAALQSGPGLGLSSYQIQHMQVRCCLLRSLWRPRACACGWPASELPWRVLSDIPFDWHLSALCWPLWCRVARSALVLRCRSRFCTALVPALVTGVPGRADLVNTTEPSSGICLASSQRRDVIKDQSFTPRRIPASQPHSSHCPEMQGCRGLCLSCITSQDMVLEGAAHPSC